MTTLVAEHAIQRRGSRYGRIELLKPQAVFEAGEAEATFLVAEGAAKTADDVDKAMARKLASQGIKLITERDRLPRVVRSNGGVTVVAPDPKSGLFPGETPPEALAPAAPAADEPLDS